MMTHHWDDPYRLPYYYDSAYPWHYNYQHLNGPDDHWDDSVHHWDYNYQHWDDNDHYWNMNQNPLGGADLGCKPSKNLRFRKMQRFLFDDLIVILKQSRTSGDRPKRFGPNLVCTRVGNANALEKRL